jgi:chloramphenicol O-acetyltransferase type A
VKKINIEHWNRKQHYMHFKDFKDPYFAVTIPFNITKAYKSSKNDEVSFFSKYLHDCMKAINAIDNLKLRIEKDEVVLYEVINASATLMRADNTFALSYIKYDENLDVFINNLESEKQRVLRTNDFYPPIDSLDCIHCSAMPWLNFQGHKEAVSGNRESVPKLAFGKTYKSDGELMMNLAINVNHALVDGYHVGLFVEEFQKNLNN